jgi:hypothetical protein
VLRVGVAEALFLVGVECLADFFAETFLVAGLAEVAVLFDDAKFLIAVVLLALTAGVRRTSRIALVCSSRVIRNSWWPSRLATK